MPNHPKPTFDFRIFSMLKKEKYFDLHVLRFNTVVH